MKEAVLSLQGVTKRFGSRIALENVDLELHRGTTLGIVGESGSGKSTCLRLAVRLERPSAGQVLFDGTPYPRSNRGMRSIRARMGLVFQDPYESLDPRMRLLDVVGEPLRSHGGRWNMAERVKELLAAVGLPDAPLDSYPSRYSGGGRQRIAIARALALEPEVLLCDEPTASLDVSVQAQIVNLLLELRRTRGLSMIFVSHDLDLVRRVADDLVVMYAGRVLESGPSSEIYSRPRHPYTLALLAAIPSDHPHKRKHWTRAASTDPVATEVDRSGCIFTSRCPKVQDVCRSSRPALHQDGAPSRFACHFPESPVEGSDRTDDQGRDARM